MMLRSLRVVADRSGRRWLHVATRPLLAAEKAAPAGDAVDPSNPIIAPSVVPGREYKNEFYEKRGYTLADKNWTEWSDLPAPYKYFGVKVDPKHVEGSGFLWKAMYDWKLAIPMSLLVAMPLWMTGNFPGFDERLEVSLVTLLAGTVIVKEVGPMFKAMKKSVLEPKIKALYDAEKSLNDEIAHAVGVFGAGQAIPETMKTVHAGERALRQLEAAAATTKAKIAVRDATVAELDFLVALRSQGAAESEGAALKAARVAVETALEKDAALQQKSIEAAIKALREGSSSASDDVVAPAFAAALAKAASEAAAKPASNPFTSKAQIESFGKRFGYNDGVTKAIAGGKVTLKAPILYAKKA